MSADNLFGVGDAVVGDHGLEEGLVQTWLGADARVGDDGVEDFAGAGHVVQNAALGVDRGMRSGRLLGAGQLLCMSSSTSSAAAMLTGSREAWASMRSL